MTRDEFQELFQRSLNLAAAWDPTGSGPFKQLIAEKIVDRRVHRG
jgi:hypothetical protein